MVNLNFRGGQLRIIIFKEVVNFALLIVQVISKSYPTPLQVHLNSIQSPLTFRHFLDFQGQTEVKSSFDNNGQQHRITPNNSESVAEELLLRVGQLRIVQTKCHQLQIQ